MEQNVVTKHICKIDPILAQTLSAQNNSEFHIIPAQGLARAYDSVDYASVNCPVTCADLDSGKWTGIGTPFRDLEPSKGRIVTCRITWFLNAWVSSSGAGTLGHVVPVLAVNDILKTSTWSSSSRLNAFNATAQMAHLYHTETRYDGQFSGCAEGRFVIETEAELPVTRYRWLCPGLIVQSREDNIALSGYIHITARIHKYRVPYRRPEYS